MSRYGYYSEYSYFRQPTSNEIACSARAYIEKQRKKGIILHPVAPKTSSRTICTTWWGISWCQNLERYSDYSNRLPRGRKYVNAEAVLDLNIHPGYADALVQGSSPYKIKISIDPLSKKREAELVEACFGRVKNMEDFLNGKFPQELKEVFYDAKGGLFPSPREIHFSCSCPDIASMCKHVAASMYGIGLRLDEDPMGLFTLRGIDADQFIARALEGRVEDMLKNARKKSSRIMDDASVGELFGVL